MLPERIRADRPVDCDLLPWLLAHSHERDRKRRNRVKADAIAGAIMFGIIFVVLAVGWFS